MTELTDEEAKALLAECDNPDCLTCEYARALLDARAELARVKADAIAAWNRRATPTALAASPEVAALIAAERARIVQAITFGFPPEDRFIRMTDVLAAIESAALRGEKEPK